MFRSFSLDKFGLRLKNIRKELGLTMRDVEQATGINKNTIVQLESGKSYPKYETLEILSVLYKVDLLEILIRSRASDSFLNVYSQLDQAVVTRDKDLIHKLKGDIKNIQSNEIIDKNEKEQFKLLIDALELSYSNFTNSNDEAAEVLIKALKLRIPHFNPAKIEENNYTFIEIRLLYTMSVILGLIGNVSTSNKVMIFLEEKLIGTIYSEEIRLRMLLRIISNLAYNYYRIGDDEKTIEYSDKGIELCLKHSMYEALDVLYFRKGIAMYNLKKEDYLVPLKKSVYILYSSNNLSKLETYMNVLKNSYGIEIEL